MEKQRTRLEKFILLIAYVGLIGGTLFAFLYSKGVLESGQDMCVPRAIANFIFIEGASILGWAVLKQIVKISDRLRHIENKMDGANRFKQPFNSQRREMYHIAEGVVKMEIVKILIFFNLSRIILN